LLILDEVQCGIARTGKFFAFEHAKIKPDIVPIAKGIGGGFPLGAVLMTKKVASGMIPGTHGTTNGGNPLAMSVGNAVLDKIFKKGFLKSVQKISKYFHNELNKIKNDYPKLIKEVRGIGFLIGLQLFNDPTQFIKKLQDNKLLTIRSGENTIRILPPLIVKKAEIDIAIKIIRKVCKEF
jgi:acetylornithine/N-succinyldiaminopimelate aminotransferase